MQLDRKIEDIQAKQKYCAQPYTKPATLTFMDNPKHNFL